VYECD